MIQFQGFKPESMPKIANSLGYNGDMQGFQQYLDQNKDKQDMMNQYTQKAQQMAAGGVPTKYKGFSKLPEGVQQKIDPDLAQKFNVGGQAQPRQLNQQIVPSQNIPTGSTIQGAMTQQAINPGLPSGTAVAPVGTTITAGQLVDPTSGQLTGPQAAVPTALAGTQQAAAQGATQAANIKGPALSAPSVQGAQANAAQSGVSAGAQMQGAQANPQQLAQLGLQAAQGQAATVQGAPTPMQMTAGQSISGSAVDQSQVQQIFGQQPLEASTVSGELDTLMQDFQGGKTPSWAAGAMRAANSAMAARGLGASSMAGMAVVQAAMESALPIAQMDASNKQQIAVESARQRANFLQMDFNQEFEAKVKNAARVSEIANINFSAEQQIALENSKMSQTMNLANLSNSQAKVMADAASMSQMDMANLNNRQQAAVQTAQAFLQTDMANLSNRQQSEMFNAQTRAQSMFTDQAAENATKQFNATSQMQTDQFFSSLASNNAQFNASQSNAQAQFNAGQVNVLERFNTEINNQRDQFNAQNRLVIDQANAQWRRQIATADTAAVNRANEINAASLLGVSQSAYNNLWQTASDNMEWAWTSAENERKRVNDLAMVKLQADASFDAQKYKSDAESSSGFGALIGSIFTSNLSNTIGGSILSKIF